MDSGVDTSLMIPGNRNATGQLAPTSVVPIFQEPEVGCPIRKSTDQSLFAAPHGFSQRITSFIACACQGIHQMPLRHLIVLIANAHHLVPVSSETATDRVTFYNPANPTMPSTCSIGSLYWNYAEQFTCVRSLRPASRD